MTLHFSGVVAQNQLSKIAALWLKILPILVKRLQTKVVKLQTSSTNGFTQIIPAKARHQNMNKKVVAMRD